MHSASLEILADAHRQLSELPGVNPVSSAEGSIAEVVQEDDDAPAAVGQALEICRNADSKADAQRAADKLRTVLNETSYDPSSPDSHYPA